MVRYAVPSSTGMKRMVLVARKLRSSESSTTDRAGTRGGHRYVLCTDNREYPASLERGKVYRTLEDPRAARHGLLRVVDESGEDYLYPRDRFVRITLPRQARRALAGKP
jgi:hypothetical protein